MFIGQFLMLRTIAGANNVTRRGNRFLQAAVRADDMPARFAGGFGGGVFQLAAENAHTCIQRIVAAMGHALEQLRHGHIQIKTDKIRATLFGDKSLVTPRGMVEERAGDNHVLSVFQVFCRFLARELDEGDSVY